MDRKHRTLLLMTLVVVGLGLCCLVLLPKKSDGLAKVYMLNVGQGDSFLIEAKNGRQLLIDGGRDARVLSELRRVMPRGDKSIDVVIATHPDADHIGGLPLVLSRYKVGLFLSPDTLTDTADFRALYASVEKEKIPAYYIRRGMTLLLDKNTALPASFAVLFPDRSTVNWETNSSSVVGTFTAGQRSALFTGDSYVAIEHFLAINDPKSIDVDILKIGHHGSKTSSSEEFLRATSPALALISAGVANRYGHPAKEVIDRLQKLDIPFVSTQELGTVTLATDGMRWWQK